MEEAEKRMVFSRDLLCAVPWAQGQDMLSWGVHVLPVGPDAQQRRAAFLWEGTGGKWNFVEAVLSKGSSKVCVICIWGGWRMEWRRRPGLSLEQ